MDATPGFEFTLWKVNGSSHPFAHLLANGRVSRYILKQLVLLLCSWKRISISSSEPPFLPAGKVIISKILLTTYQIDAKIMHVITEGFRLSCMP